MGGQTCGEQKIHNEDPLSWKFEEDSRNNMKEMDHRDDLLCRNKESQKLLETYQEKLQADKKMYQDPSMPIDPILLKSKNVSFKCTYERPQKFLEEMGDSKLYKIFDRHDNRADSIEVNDEIMQYFGVFLCFLADKPNLIQNIITTNENSYGIHVIEAFKDGQIINFLIDDYILCRENKPMFSQPYKMMYMWPCLIEKAWFKIRGNLAKRVEQTSPEEVFETFAPLPIEKIYLDEGIINSSSDRLQNLFQDFDTQNKRNKNFILTSKTNPEHDLGISGKKHFYLLDTFKYEGKRLFYVRNPCGDVTLRGTYSVVPSEVSQILFDRGFIHIKSGNFIIDEEQFLEQFNQIMVIYYYMGNQINTFTFNCSNAEEFFIGFNLTNKGQLNLKVTQQKLALSKNKNYYPLMYHILRLADEKIIGGRENVEGCFGVKHTYLLDNFENEGVGGKYIIRLKKKQYHKSIQEVRTYLTSYYSEKINFEIVNQEEMNAKWQGFLLNDAKKRLSISNKKIKGADIAHIISWLGDIVTIYIEKINPKKEEISIEVNFPELMNLQCISHPQIRRSDQWKTYKFSNQFIFVFQKIDLSAETHIRQYHLESY